MGGYLDSKEEDEDEKDILDEGIPEDEEVEEEVEDGTDDTEEEEEDIEEVATRVIPPRNPAIPIRDFTLGITFNTMGDISIECSDISMLSPKVVARMNHRITKMLHVERARVIQEMRMASKK